MKPNRLLLLIAALCFMATAASYAKTTDNPQVGTWKLDEAKSKIESGSPKNNTVVWAEGKAGMMMLTVDGVDKDGKAVHWTWSGKFDGKQQKAEGSSAFDTAGFLKLSDHTLSATGMKDGKTVFSGTIKVSKDGKSRMVTMTTTAPDGTKHTDQSYYMKQ